MVDPPSPQAQQYQTERFLEPQGHFATLKQGNVSLGEDRRFIRPSALILVNVSLKSEIRFSSDFLEGSNSDSQSSYDSIREYSMVFPASKSLSRSSSRHFSLAKWLSVFQPWRCELVTNCSSSPEIRVLASDVRAKSWTLPRACSCDKSSIASVILSKSLESDCLSLAVDAPGVAGRGVMLALVAVSQVI